MKNPFAKDLSEVAKINQLSEEKVIELHHQPVYQVYFIGFLPGFPYLGGLNEQICAPRKEKARSKISKGDVGIAGCQTGIYPVDSPGGWQIIGNSPIDLVQFGDEVNTVLKSGDTLSFYPISKEEHQAIKNQDKKIDLNIRNMSFTVIRQGLFDTIQDHGRPLRRAKEFRSAALWMNI